MKPEDMCVPHPGSTSARKDGVENPLVNMARYRERPEEVQAAYDRVTNAWAALREAQEELNAANHAMWVAVDKHAHVPRVFAEVMDSCRAIARRDLPGSAEREEAISHLSAIVANACEWVEARK